MNIHKSIWTVALALSACEPYTIGDDDSPTIECKQSDSASTTGVSGCWQLDSAIASEEGLLVIRPTGDSRARLYFFLGESLYYAIFDVQLDYVVEADGETGDGDGDGDGDGGGGPSGEVDFAFECLAVDQNRPCAELDFKLRCTYNTEQRTIGSCTLPVDDKWTGYPFSWTRCTANNCPTLSE